MRLPITGVDSPSRSNASISSGRLNSRAIASRCNTAFVEPAVAPTARMAFSSALPVTMSRGFRFLRTSSTAISPERSAAAILSGSVAGMPFRPAGERPITSSAMLIVLAVN